MRTFFFQRLNTILFFLLICLSSNIESAPIDLILDEFAEISPNSLNEEAVLDQFQDISRPTKKQLHILEELLMLCPEEQQDAFNQIAALPYTSLFQIAELNTRKFLRRLYVPLRKIIAVEPEDRCGCINKYRMGSWLDAGYDRTHINTNDCFEDYTWNGYDVSLGVQSSMNPCWTLGFAGSYERDEINFQLGAKGTAQTFLVGAYSLLRPDNYYFLGDFIAGYGRYSIRRPIDIDTHHFHHKGNPQLYQSMAYIEAGYDFPFQGCFNTYLFQPFLGLEIGYFRYHSLHEKTKDPLFNIGIAGRSHVTFSGRLGIHFTTELFSCIKVAIDAAWQHRCTSLDNHIREHFLEFGCPISIKGLHISHDSFDGAINLAINLEENLRLYIEAAGQIWDRASTYNTFIGFQFGW